MPRRIPHRERDRRRSTGSIAARALTLAAALALVAGSSANGAEPAGELRIGVARVPETLDPAGPGAGATWLVARQIFEGLVEIGEGGELTPGLASHWTVSRDGLTWTFRLRPDVQFHDGTPLTADVVVASLARLAAGEDAPEEPWLAVLRGKGAVVREVRRGGPGTVEVQLSQPFSPLLAVLAHPALAIVLPQNDSTVPFLGTGPYRVAERSPGRLLLEATGTPGDRARTPRLVFEELADDPAGLAELGPSGRLDVYLPRAAPPWGGLGLQTLTGPTWQVGVLALRTHQGLTARKSVRQAIALALDPALLGPALGRGARPHAALLPPGAWGARPTQPAAPDQTRARRLLTEAGAAGRVMTLLVPEPSGKLESGRVAEAVRLSLAVTGLTVQIRQPAGETYGQALRQGDGEIALQEVGHAVDDPHFLLRSLAASDTASRGSATNTAFYRKPAADALLLRASQLAFRPERLRLYQRLQAQLAEDVPYIPLYVRLQWAVTRTTVRDLRLDPSGRHRLERVWVEAPAGPPGPVTPGAPASGPDRAPVGPPVLTPPGGGGASGEFR